MIETAPKRAAAIAVLLLVQCAFFPLYASQPVNPSAGVYPGPEEFLPSPDEYTGRQVVVTGFVRDISPVELAVGTSSGPKRLVVTGISRELAAGDKVRVQGTLIAPATVDASTTVVVGQRSRLLTWGVSLIAALWVLGRLVRDWRIEWGSGAAFVPRETPRSVHDGRKSGDRSDA